MLNSTMKKQLWICAAICFILGLAAIFYLVYFQQNPLLYSFTAGLSLVVILLPYLLLMFNHWQNLVIGMMRQWPLILRTLPLIYLLPYLVFAIGTASFSLVSLTKLSLFLIIPWLLILAAERWEKFAFWFEAAALTAIWLPFDCGWIKDIWLFPKGEAAYVLNAALAVSYAIILFRCVRMQRDIGFELKLSLPNLRIAATYFSVFFAIALVFGLISGFIKYNGSILPLKTAAIYPGILLFIAIPEELLFRGMLQTLLTKVFKNPTTALLCASIFFGLTHLNNGPHPDWRYVVLATVAGVTYGAAFLKTKNLTAPALIHAMVDAVWVGYFM